MPSPIFSGRLRPPHALLRALLSLAAFILYVLILSAAASAQAPNPVPTITSLSPSVFVAGSAPGGAAVTLTVTGTGFLSGSLIEVNTMPLQTTLVTSQDAPPRLTANVGGTLTNDVGTINITVVNPAPGGGTSNTLNFVVSAPVPAISFLSPGGIESGGAPGALTVNGSGFVSSSVVQWNGQPLTTSHFKDANLGLQLLAALSAAQVTALGTATITVVNPAPGGGTSNARAFQVIAPVPTPALVALSPAAVTEGGPDFTLTVTGTGFNGTTFVSINSSLFDVHGLATTLLSPTQVTAVIPAGAFDRLQTIQVQVVNGVAGIKYVPSNLLNLTVGPPPYPVPTVTALSPNTVPAGSGAFTLYITGTGFNKDTRVKLGAHYMNSMSIVSDTSIRVGVPASEVPATAATALVTAINPSSGPGFGGTSNAVPFTFSDPLNPVPIASAFSPLQAAQGDPDLTLTVTGSNFIPSSLVRWNGTALATTYVSAFQLTAAVPAALLANAGQAIVSVFTPAPGGGLAANSLPFAVLPRPNPVPTITALTPDHCFTGLGSFRVHISGTEIVSGTNIVTGAQATVNGYQYYAVVGTLTNTGMDIVLPDNILQKPGTLQIAVVNPDNQGAGGGASNALPFTVTLQPIVSHTHLLWNNSDGRVMLWSVAQDGTFTLNGFGPYTDNAPQNKWSATAVATGTDGLSHLLWNNTDGRVMLWTVNDAGNFTLAGYGPYTDNAPQNKWSAVGVSVGLDNTVHLLWSNTDHRAMLWNVASDFSFTLAGYGPYTDNTPQNLWTATALSTGPDNVSRIVWNNTDYRVMLWNVTSDFSFTLAGYGPYTDNAPQNKWSAVGVSVGPDNVTHLLWSNTDRRAMFWNVDSSFNFTLAGFGPYTDNGANNLWSAQAVATGPDGLSHILWGNTDDRAMLWGLDNAFNFGVVSYGPYTDNAPGNLWSVTAISAGP